MCAEGQKERLREELRRQAAGFSAAYLAASDGKITQQVLALPVFSAAETVFCYASVPPEADTRALIQEMLRLGKAVYVPGHVRQGKMDACRIYSLSELVPGRYGLPEAPPGAPAAEPGGIGLVIAPCVAADKAGYRLGNGGGYYDRYLAQLACPTVCLCRGRLLRASLPAAPHDVPVQCVICEDEIWNTGA